jgi:hypothetical protein
MICTLRVNLVPRVCLFAGYLVSCLYITREQAYSGSEIGSEFKVCKEQTFLN